MCYPWTRAKIGNAPIDKLPIGIQTFPPEARGKQAVMDLKQAEVSLIISRRGGGKTFLMKTLLSGLYFGNYLALVIPDTKNEFSMARLPCKERFHRMLNPDLATSDHLKGLPTKAYYPYFLAVLARGIIPKYCRMCVLSPKDADQNDWIKIMGLDRPGIQAQREFFEQAFWQMVAAKVNTSEGIRNYLSSIDAAAFSKTATPSTKARVAEKVRRLFTMRYFGSESGSQFTSLSSDQIVKDLLENVVVFCTQNMDMVSKEMTNEYLAIILRKIWHLKQKGSAITNKPLAIFHEEAHELAPLREEPSTKKEILSLVRLGRMFKIYQFCNYQALNEVPALIKSQAVYSFFNGSTYPTHRDEIRDFYDIPFDVWDYMLSRPFLFDKATGAREWCMATTGKLYRFVPYAPNIYA